MNATTIKVIHWIWSEPKLADFLRGVAFGDDFGWGDDQLAEWVCVFVFPEDRSRGSSAWELNNVEGSEARAVALYEALTEGRKSPAGRLEWVDETEWELVRDALIGASGETSVYVHSTRTGFHPNNRYRVHDKKTVYESGWTAPAGAWGIDEPDRQVCPEPIGERCSCMVVQRER